MFERFIPLRQGRGLGNKVSLHKLGKITVSCKFKHHFVGEWRVIYFYDKSERRIGIKPTSEKGLGIYKISMQKEVMTLCARSFLNTYDLTPSKNTDYSARWDDEEGMLVIDLN